MQNYWNIQLYKNESRWMDDQEETIALLIA